VTPLAAPWLGIGRRVPFRAGIAGRIAAGLTSRSGRSRGSLDGAADWGYIWVNSEAAQPGRQVVKMATMKDLKQRGRSWLIAGALIVVGVLVGQVVPHSTATATAENGTLTSVSQHGADSSIVFQYKGSKQAFTVQSSTPWQVKPGVWHSTGQPSCLASKPRTPLHITLGVINVQAAGTLPEQHLVVWIKCEG
jgi:hypothetical protein